MGELPALDANYVRRELTRQGIRIAPDKVIEVCRLIAQGAQSREGIAEGVGLHHATVRKISTRWEQGHLDFLRPYVFALPQLLPEDREFRKWLADRLDAAVSAVQDLNDLYLGFPWYGPDASLPKRRLLDPVQQRVIDGIRRRSPLLRSLESRWEESAGECLACAKSLRDQLAKELRGSAPPGLEGRWAKVLVLVTSGALSGLEFGTEHTGSDKVNLRLGAFGLAENIGVDEAGLLRERFAALLEGADTQAEELREKGSRLRVLSGHIAEVLDGWLQL